jgi:hypothetical protein
MTHGEVREPETNSKQNYGICHTAVARKFKLKSSNSFRSIFDIYREKHKNYTMIAIACVK